MRGRVGCANGEFGDDAAKDKGVGLGGEQRGDRIGGPGTELEGPWEFEVRGFALAAQGFAKGAREAWAVNVEWSDFGDCDGEVGADRWLAATDGDGAGLIVAVNDGVGFVPAGNVSQQQRRAKGGEVDSK